MKRSIIIIFSIIVSFFMTSSGFAQRAIRQSESSLKPKSFFEAGFWDNWFVGLSGGVSMYFGEEDRKNPDGFFSLLTPNIKLSVGKWLRPSYGLRLQTEGAWLRGWNDGIDNETIYTWNKLVFDNSLIYDHVLDYNPKRDRMGKGYYQEMRYADLHLDFMVNLINLWQEYDVNRPVDIILYGGAGWAHMFPFKGIPEDEELVGKFGAMLNVKLSDRLSGTLELQSSLVNESFDGQIGGQGISRNVNRTLEGYGSLTAGISYRLLNTFTQYEYIDPEVVKDLNARVNNMLEDQKRLQEKLDEYCLKDSCDKFRRQLQEALDMKCREKLYVVIHYIIDEWSVRSSELYKLDEIADFMRKYPEITISVTGYADAKTAYPAYNLKLGKRRANEVVRILTGKFRIEKNRIKYKSLGDTMQPFRENERNRAVIAFDIEE